MPPKSSITSIIPETNISPFLTTSPGFTIGVPLLVIISLIISILCCYYMAGSCGLITGVGILVSRNPNNQSGSFYFSRYPAYIFICKPYFFLNFTAIYILFFIPAFILFSLKNFNIASGVYFDPPNTSISQIYKDIIYTNIIHIIMPEKSPFFSCIYDKKGKSMFLLYFWYNSLFS